MKYYLAYDPNVVTDPAGLATTLNVPFEGVIAKQGPVMVDVTLPAAGYCVFVHTWQGITKLDGPLTHDDILAVPDPGPDPDEVARLDKYRVKLAMSQLTGDIDPTLIEQAINRLDNIIATGSVPALPASPTNADVIAQVRTLTTAVNLIADAVRDMARIEKGIIKYLA